MNKDNFRKYGIFIAMIIAPIVLVGSGIHEIIDGLSGYINGNYSLISLLNNDLVMQCILGVLIIAIGIYVAWAVYPDVKAGARDWLQE